MATQIWRGDAAAVKQVSSATITADDATTTYKVTINGKVVSVLGSGTGATATATALAAALVASTIPEFQEVTWTSSGAVVTGTSVTAGVRFTCTSSVSGGAGTFGAFSTTTASQGPNDWDIAANWSTGSVPVNSDDVDIPPGSSAILNGLGQPAVSLTSLAIRNSNQIGLPKVNAASNYYEYRTTDLQISATTIRIGEGNGPGNSLVRLDTGSGNTTLTVFNTGSSLIQGVPAVTWKGSGTNSVNVLKGDFGAAVFAGETATIATLRVGYVNNPVGDATVTVGSGVTLSTTLDMTGGNVVCHCNLPTTTTMQNGTLTIDRAATGTTVTVYGGTLNWWSTGTITTLNLYSATLDCTSNVGSATLTNANLYSGATINDPDKRITWSNALVVKAPLSALSINRGPSFSLAMS